MSKEHYASLLGVKGTNITPDYYQLLGLEPDCQDTELLSQAASQILERIEHHPLKPGPEKAEALASLRADIEKASRVLNNPEEKADYDDKLTEIGDERPWGNGEDAVGIYIELVKFKMNEKEVKAGFLDQYGKIVLLAIAVMALLGLGVLGTTYYLQDQEQQAKDKAEFQEYADKVQSAQQKLNQLQTAESMGLSLLLAEEVKLLNQMSADLKEEKYAALTQVEKQLNARIQVQDQVLKHWVALNQSAKVSPASLQPHDDLIESQPNMIVLQEYRVLMVEYLVDRLADQAQLAAAVQILHQQLERRPDHQVLKDKLSSIQARIEARERLTDAKVALEKAWVDSDYEGTIVAAEALLKLDPDQEKAHELIRMAKQEIQRRKHLQLMIDRSEAVRGSERLELIKDIEHYIKNNPDMSEAKALLVQTQEAADKEAVFNEHMKKAIQLDQEGKISAAQSELIKALAIFPDDVDAKKLKESITQRLYVTQLLQKAVREKTLGNKDKALELLDELLKIDPSHADAQEFRLQWSRG